MRADFISSARRASGQRENSSFQRSARSRSAALSSALRGVEGVDRASGFSLQ
ncbi:MULTISPECIES: hypothetical protein [unclassified Variovorax]|jgi:hypothetical protein|uniref:hypothetical protein n=1 Tax=unclassified Variovorax TaxID=663243 RepID=UPI0013DF5FBF|nr:MULTISPECIES: hypothetical protein [unclassified Variovorax]